MDNPTSNNSTPKTKRSRFTFSLRSLIILFVGFAICLAWLIDHRNQAREIAALQAFDATIYLNANSGAFGMRTSLINSTPYWNFSNSPPPVTLQEALRKSDKVVELLNINCKPFKIEEWRLSSLELLPLDIGLHQTKRHGRWCYHALFVGFEQVTSFSTDSRSNYSVIIMMDGKMYSGNKLFPRNIDNRVNDAMKQSIPPAPQVPDR